MFYENRRGGTGKRGRGEEEKRRRGEEGKRRRGNVSSPLLLFPSSAIPAWNWRLLHP
jgi:hypothetical protein